MNRRVYDHVRVGMSDQEQIYTGPRNSSFKKLITDLLERGNLKSKYIDVLTADINMTKYGQAFTAASANETCNYEIFEQLGDLSANKFIVWYAYNRFPQLRCPLGVKVVARLRINYGARKSFSRIADDLGFWSFISASEEERSRKKKDLLEDCLESFVGCTESILDEAFRPGVGYGIVYDILSSVFDKIPMSLRYNDLYDSKTRLKELFDAYKDLGTWVYIDTRDEMLAESTLYRVPDHCTCKRASKRSTGPGRRDFVLVPHRDWVRIGNGVAAKKSDAQQKAAEDGLSTLRRDGWTKAVPAEYDQFCAKAE